MDRKPITRLALIVDDATYELDADQILRLNEWRDRVIQRIDEINGNRPRTTGLAAWFKQRGEVYTGVVSVDLTFSVTPTGIGTVFKASEGMTGESVDLTDYNW